MKKLFSLITILLFVSGCEAPKDSRPSPFFLSCVDNINEQIHLKQKIEEHDKFQETMLGLSILTTVLGVVASKGSSVQFNNPQDNNREIEWDRERLVLLGKAFQVNNCSVEGKTTSEPLKHN